MEAVRKGTLAVGVRGEDIFVLGVYPKAVHKLQDPRTLTKIQLLDDHISVDFARFTADARILIQRSVTEWQSPPLTPQAPNADKSVTP